MDDRWSKFAVGLDPFDVMAFKRALGASGTLKKTLDPKKLATAPELGQDVYDSVFKYVPELRKTDEVDPAYHFNRSLVEKAMGTPEYTRLRAVTALAEPESTVATEVIAKELLENLPEEDREAVNEYHKAQTNLSNALDKLKALDDLGKLTPKLKSLQTGLKKKVPGLQQAVQQAQQAFNQACQNPAVKAAFRQAVGAAVDELAMIGDFAGGWGMEPGQLTKVPAKERIDLMRRIANSAKIRELNKLMGRMKRLAFQKRYTRITKEPSEVTDIITGNDLSRVIPSELVNLAVPELKVLFLKKYVNNELLVYELKGRETFGRGPIIILIDNSGSMGAAADGITREMWAKAMGLAMAEIALRDKRDIEFLNFSSRSEISMHVVPHTLPPEKRLEALITVAEEFYGGGTDFETPLMHALKDVDKSMFKKADIIMVTDGDCEVSEAFSEEFSNLREKKGVRLHSVVIGSHSESLKGVSDTYAPLYDILTQGDDVAGQLFEAV